jgi:putative oxidoreductase
MILIMVGAIAMVHGKVGFFMNWMGQQGGEGFEYHLLAIAVLATILIAGPGRLAIGRFLPLPKRNDQPVLILE